MTTDESIYLKRHLLDLARQADTQNRYTFSNFLGLAEQEVYQNLAGELSFIGHRLEGGSEMAERGIVVFGDEKSLGYPPELPIQILSIRPKSEKFGEELSHRDYLGAILNLGIERELLGDIIIRGKNAWLIAIDSICPFLQDSLTTVRHTTVVCEPVSGEVPELQPVFEDVRVNVASERLDAVVAAFTNISRNHAVDLFPKQRVFVNGKVMMNLSYNLKEGDVLSIRGFGKAIYRGIDGTSRKGRLYVLLQKYV